MSTDNRRAFESLHLLLQKLTNANQLLEHGPKRVANCEQKVVAAQEVCDHQKAEIQQIKKKADQTALHLKTSEGDVDKQKLRLNDAKSNKEYEIIIGSLHENSGCGQFQITSGHDIMNAMRTSLVTPVGTGLISDYHRYGLAKAAGIDALEFWKLAS